MYTLDTIDHYLIPASYGGVIEVKKGQYVSVVDVKGGQCADFWAINQNDFQHFLSPPHCWIDLFRIQPKVGDRLVTNRRDPILTIIADDVGWHDMLIPSCDSKRYEYHFGVTDHRNCVDNFREALSKYNWGDRPVPQPFNIFMNTYVEPDGRVSIRVPTSKAGDQVIMQAEFDILAVSSSCPMDLNETGARGVSEILLLVSDNIEELRNATID